MIMSRFFPDKKIKLSVKRGVFIWGHRKVSKYNYTNLSILLTLARRDGGGRVFFDRAKVQPCRISTTKESYPQLFSGGAAYCFFVLSKFASRSSI
jgi:hypothetical protein